MRNKRPREATSTRVLVHVNSLELGGTQINAVDFARELAARGIESILVGQRDTAGEGPSLLDYARTRGVIIEPYDPQPGMSAHARQLRRIAERLRVDLVHVYGMWGAARPVYWGAARYGRLPWVQTVYDMSVASVVHRYMPLIVGTGYLLEELADRPGETVLISPPVDLAADSPVASGAARFREEHDLGPGALLGIVSRLDSRTKAPAIGAAIDAMHELATYGATLFVVGGGDADRALQARADALNEVVGRRVVCMLGPVADPRPAYAAADIMLGMGGSAARSLAFGKPLIVQGEAGWCRLFDEQTADSLAFSSFWSPENPQQPGDDLVRVAGMLITDAPMRRELGEFGREFAIRRFGLDAMSDRLEQFYMDALRVYGPREWLSDLPREGQRLLEKFGRRLQRTQRAGHEAGVRFMDSRPLRRAAVSVGGNRMSDAADRPSGSTGRWHRDCNGAAWL